MSAVLGALLLAYGAAGWGAALPYHGAPAPWCQEAQITGYSRFEHSSHTYDGTPILTPEPIAAASWNFPLGWLVDVEGVGTFRIADRGSGLGSSGWVDIAVWTRAEAFSLTSRRAVCVYPPGG